MKISNTYIAGNLIDEPTGKNFNLINPANENQYGTLVCSSVDQVNQAVKSAKENEKVAANISIDKRIDILQSINDQIKTKSKEFAEAMTLEMGAPITLTSNAHIQMGIDHLINTISELKKYNFEEKYDGYKVIKMPIGVSALITPWNWPLNQTLTKIASAIAAGCPIILKPSEYSPVSSRLLIDVIDNSTLPKGCFNCVNGVGSEIGPIISTHPDIKMISFTGSTIAGIDIQEKAAKTVKRVSLELGGKSAHIVCEGVDLNAVIPIAINQCFVNSGQSCSAPTRLLIPEVSINNIKNIIVDHIKTLIFNDPNDVNTTHGPVVNQKQYNTIQEFIKSGIDEGYEIVTGGLGNPDNCNSGYFIRPTVFINVDNSATIAQEEIFGPVLSIISYSSIDNAIDIANNSKYGLSNYITCLDYDDGYNIAKRIHSGQSIINKIGRGSVPAPFGGFKLSGNGREHGKYGLEEYLEIKAII